MECFAPTLYCILLALTCLHPVATSLLPWSPEEQNDKKFETCQTETFHAECGQDEVIVMTSARYGRMELGRCVKQSLGYLGCYGDVLGVLDTMCSGRRRCGVRIPDPLLDATNPCFGELKSYLEASYTCIEVIAPVNTCDGSPIKLTRPEGYLSSYVALTTSCGLEQSPWLLQAEPGQRINITFFDFSLQSSNGGVFYESAPRTSHCSEYAFITDKATGTKIKLCPGGRRLSHAYTSINNSLQITMRSESVRESSSQFLIYYQFTGCPDKNPPEDMVFERTSTLTSVLKCKESNERFDLVCDGNTWKGDIQNCSKVELIHAPSEDTSSMRDNLVLVCLIGLCVIICAVLIATILFCVKRMGRRSDRHFYNYNANSLYPNHQQENLANLKQLQIDNPDLAIRHHDVIYKPLMPGNRVQDPGANHQQTECLLCNAQRQERAYDLPPEHNRTYAPPKNPRVFNNYSPKQSNIRKTLSLKLHSQSKHQSGCQKKPTHAQNNTTQSYGVGTKIPLNKSLDCDMMLQYEPVLMQKKDIPYPGETIANSSLLNKTL